MIILNRDGTLEWKPVDRHPDDRTADSIELPAELVAQQSNLFDRVFAFAFDVLGLVTVELRIRTRASEAAE
jgi:hypothetical protein